MFSGKELLGKIHLFPSDPQFDPSRRKFGLLVAGAVVGSSLACRLIIEISRSASPEPLETEEWDFKKPLTIRRDQVTVILLAPKPGTEDLESKGMFLAVGIMATAPESFSLELESQGGGGDASEIRGVALRYPGNPQGLSGPQEFNERLLELSTSFKEIARQEFPYIQAPQSEWYMAIGLVTPEGMQNIRVTPTRVIKGSLNS